jgi:hypothetical protein
LQEVQTLFTATLNLRDGWSKHTLGYGAPSCVPEAHHMEVVKADSQATTLNTLDVRAIVFVQVKAFKSRPSKGSKCSRFVL